jgi:anti-anti-sigma factor
VTVLCILANQRHSGHYRNVGDTPSWKILGEGTEMNLVSETLPGGVTKVVLDGQLDIMGAQTIDLRFSVIAGSSKAVVVDLSAVSFVASIGIRTLLTGAKTVQSKGGKLVLLSPTPAVEKVLKVTGVDTLMPIFGDLDAAIQAVAP